MVLPVYLSVFFFFFLFADHSASADECPGFFDCGNLGKLGFPLTTPERKDCGMLPIHGCEDPNAQKTVQLGKKMFQVTRIGIGLIPQVVVRDTYLEKRLASNNCDAFCSNITSPPNSALGSIHIWPFITMYKCNTPLNQSLSKQFLNYTGCAKGKNETIFFRTQDPDDPLTPLATCPSVQLPVNMLSFSPDPFTFIASEFHISFKLSPGCVRCLFDNGSCRLNSTREFYCLKDEIETERRAWKLGLLIGVPSATVVIIIGLAVILLRNKRRHKSLGSQNQSRTIESDNTHSNVILEDRHIYFKFPVFSYEELEEATNKFDQSRELGSGGFGTVYYGKLKDGREVAVKRLFERNSCVQQFMNEVKILTRLRHKNLVSLYGCTSRTSRELLLVYEYIPNGTLGCHLHGNLAKSGSLPWPLRMRIAIETANALSYLHASGIIHRDVLVFPNCFPCLCLMSPRLQQEAQVIWTPNITNSVSLLKRVMFIVSESC
ncbi:LEAF RUST 10 DISEASE-RESISTANCE LOCUS RECEPTOR-LIKE PROTEIN KINASE-like 1.1 [Neltuma alba]|uniref:LEAF RUST 10 DISEASE-RESISTANCE LOCUS RECEPTOR-LIKE PROTEIN KINASE-like 1.1 n=1 Tax=Neltuma alba TaxID=207710 RepID=UPI0010A572F6|nr:LEAF RUST 10 DISEASE-RESISTANCE LOCUS RECEPTOR-LIKE PROTEIN KINASE-like 1.1 [Prosopis alba]